MILLFYKKENKQLEQLLARVQEMHNNQDETSHQRIDTSLLEGAVLDLAHEVNRLLDESEARLKQGKMDQKNAIETLQHQTQQTIEDEQFRLEHVLQTNHIGMWEQTFIDGNPATYTYSQTGREILGYHTVEEFPDAAESWANTVHPDDRERVFAAYAASLSDKTGRTPFVEEHRCLVRGKGYRWFLGVSYIKRDANGLPTQLIGCFQDIHDKKMEIEKLNALLVQAEIIDKALSLSPVSSEGIWGLSVIRDVQHDTPCWFSPQVKGLLGYEGDEFPPLVSSLFDRIHPEDLPLVKNMFAQNQFKEKVRIRHKDLTYRVFYLVGEAGTEPIGQFKTIAGSLIDITKEEKRKELELMLSKQMGEFSRSITDMVNTIKQLSQDAQGISSTYVETSESVQVTKHTIEETKNITDLIKSIAEQINLLGLNANIEAARAGVHGNGFAVVANEVRNLAINSTKATEDIEEIINKIRESANGILTTMDALQSKVHSQVATTDGVNKQAEGIEKMSLELLENFKKIQ